ncbi:MAG: hypothetical protein JNK03_11125 [Nitrospira sp.]|nr:hypothetical protein [Nitrospira sp.]
MSDQTQTGSHNTSRSHTASEQSREDRSRAIQELAERDALNRGTTSHAKTVDLAQHRLDDSRGKLQQSFNDAASRNEANSSDQTGRTESAAGQAAERSQEERSRAIQELAERDAQGQDNRSSYAKNVDLAQYPMDENQGELQQSFNQAAKGREAGQSQQSQQTGASDRTQGGQLSQAEERSRRMAELANQDQQKLGHSTHNAHRLTLER